MNFVDIVFFFYMFVGLYMLSLLVLIHIPSKKRLFEHPIGKPEPVSIIMPCFNDGEHIGEAINSLLNLDYPKDMIEIIVVDDKSTDNSVAIVKKYTSKYKNVRLIIHEKNSGCAAGPTNTGIKAAKYNYIATADADSTPAKDALIKMIGFLQQDDKTAAVTCAVLAKKPETFFQKVQAIEYSIIAWNRKLFDMIDSVYVTPGPFALYRKKNLIDAGLFDTNNLTQDIEIVWRLRSRGYNAKMCLDTLVESATPLSFSKWFKQRVRWNIGGTQTLLKYKKSVFRNGMLGGFIIPFFSASLFLGLVGLGLFSYIILKKFLLYYLTTKYSILGDTSILFLDDFTFSPSILNFFGLTLFLSSVFFTFEGLGVMSQKRKGNLFNIFFYMLIYLAIYPIIMITGVTKLAIGRYSW